MLKRRRLCFLMRTDVDSDLTPRLALRRTVGAMQSSRNTMRILLRVADEGSTDASLCIDPMSGRARLVQTCIRAAWMKRRRCEIVSQWLNLERRSPARALVDGPGQCSVAALRPRYLELRTKCREQERRRLRSGAPSRASEERVLLRSKRAGVISLRTEPPIDAHAPRPRQADPSSCWWRRPASRGQHPSAVRRLANHQTRSLAT